MFRSRALWCNIATELDLRDFPIDTQRLKVRFQSYSSNASRMMLQWLPTPLDPLPSETLSNSLFHVVGETTSSEMIQFRRGQTFSTLVAELEFERRVLQYELKFMFPLTLLVALSCVQYFIDSSSTPARVGFALTVILCLTKKLFFFFSTLQFSIYLDDFDCDNV